MKQMETIAALMDLQFMRASQEMPQILEREAKLRGDIAKIRAQFLNADPKAMDMIRAVGADVAWQSWAEQMLVQLNTELAQVLAQKEYLLRRVRHALGRKNTAAKLVDQQQTQHKMAQKKAALEKILELYSAPNRA